MSVAARLSPDATLLMCVNPLPGVGAVLDDTPNTPKATFAALLNAPSVTPSPVDKSAAFNPICPIAPDPFAPLVSTPSHWETTHCAFDWPPANVIVIAPLPGVPLIAR